VPAAEWSGETPVEYQDNRFLTSKIGEVNDPAGRVCQLEIRGFNILD
jgi:hypothetical protein